MSGSRAMYPYPPTRLLSACDNCHAKKTRCDRNEPCSYCIASGIACVRDRKRQKSSRKTLENRLGHMLERLARVEESLKRTEQANSSQSDQGSHPRTTPASSIVAQQSLPDADTVSSRGISSPSNSARPPKSASVETVLSSPEKQQELQQKQPQQSSAAAAAITTINDDDHDTESTFSDQSAADLERYLGPILFKDHQVDEGPCKLLQSAFSLASKTKPPGRGRGDASKQKPNFYLPSMCPSIELFYVLFSQCGSELTAQFFKGYMIFTPEHLSKMISALVNCTVHGQLRIQYIVCVNYSACLMLALLNDGTKDQMVLEHQAGLRRQYQNNVMAALDYLDTKIRPDAPFLFALCCAVYMLQELGFMRSAWKMNTIACHVCHALDSTKRLTWSLPPDEKRVLDSIFIRSFIFDRAFALDPRQPPCLVKIDIDRNSLDLDSQAQLQVALMIEMAEVQEVMVRDVFLRQNPSSQPGPAEPHACFKSLEQRMQRIGSRIDEYQSQQPTSDDGWLAWEWLGIDFEYSSTMASIIRWKNAGDDKIAYQKCLEKVRDAIDSLRTMLEHTIESFASSKRCLLTLSWAVPLFLPRPLYFLFRHVVVTSERLDLRRIKDVVRLLGENARIHQLNYSMPSLGQSLLRMYNEYTAQAEKLSLDIAGEGVSGPGRGSPSHGRHPSMSIGSPSGRDKLDLFSGLEDFYPDSTSQNSTFGELSNEYMASCQFDLYPSWENMEL